MKNIVLRFIFIIVLSLPVVSLAEAAPTSQPIAPGSPRAILIEYNRALAEGNIEQAVALVDAPTPPQKELVRQMAGFSGAMVRLIAECEKKYGLEKTRVFFGQPSAALEQANAQIEQADELINNDSATIIRRGSARALPPIRLHRVNQQWLVTLQSDAGKTIDDTECASRTDSMRRQSKVLDDCATDVQNSRYATIELLRDALRNRLLTALSPATQASTQPAK